MCSFVLIVAESGVPCMRGGEASHETVKPSAASGSAPGCGARGGEASPETKTLEDYIINKRREPAPGTLLLGRYLS